ncbi:MAG: lysophospholipid acyltransferase family protein [Flavobacteriales bacterium]|nr:lysophospholipid acyltransferase family protein [Flavobacteriales bacterium]MEB2341901.1 lysophospholipid acyltransferase family protein [Flavobacteriia bacterium]
MAEGKKLVHPAELAKASHMRPGDPRIAVLAEVSGLNRLERFYNEIRMKPGEDFIAALFAHLDLKLEVDPGDLEHVPASGGVAIVANHPYGAIDGLAMLHVLRDRRPDLKVMANFMLQQLEPLRDRFIGVNPFEQLTTRSSFQGMRQARQHLAEGGALGVFPAGEVSSYRKDLDAVADPRWKTPVIKLIRHAGVPVVPLWFDGANSMVFQILGMVHPGLRTLQLPREMLRMHGRSVRMRIGHPLTEKELARFGSVDDLARFLRAKTYSIGSGVAVRREHFKPLFFPRRPKPIVEPLPTEVLEQDLSTLDDKHLSTQGEFDLYLAPSGRIPNILQEIGRLREVTFRAVGEGSNKARDLDEFDHYYDHLFVWDREKRRLAGAYRVGDGTVIMERYGKRGFYLNTLFKLGRPMREVLAASYELGRSFVVADYQRHRLPLYMLWRGLLLHVTANPDHRYLIGPVSISGGYSKFSRRLIMEFVMKHHYDEALAKHVKPRNRFYIGIDKLDGTALLEASGEDIKKLDQVISEVEKDGSAVPVLLKRYLSLNAKIIGFNRDPHFNDSLDGLVVLDLSKVPASVIGNLRKGM